jgi:glutathione S-transferase
MAARAKGPAAPVSGYRLFGMPGSLYTAKARSYLRKQGIDFTEYPAASPEFAALLPVIGRWIVPVLQTPDGSVVQDGSVIIDDVEAKGAARFPAWPDTPVQRVVALIFELFGGEGMLRPAMHYRWNFDADNLDFVRRDFLAALAPPDATPEVLDQVFALASTRMRAATRAFGVNEATIPAIEAAHHEFLALFDAHLATSAYLLGGRPTLGDYGLIGPLFPHLGRDPAPLRLMQQRARNVFRWVERMNAPEAQRDGIGPEGLFADDAVPDTLKALLRFVADDYLPEITGHVAFANDWLAQQPGDITGTSGLANPANRTIGKAGFVWRGMPIETMVMPYRFYLLQRVQDAAGAADAPARARIDTLLAETGLADLLTLRIRRRVLRLDYKEVWGPELSA